MNIKLNKTSVLNMGSNVKIKVISIPTNNCSLENQVSSVYLTLDEFMQNKCKYFGTDTTVFMNVSSSDGKVTIISELFLF